MTEIAVSPAQLRGMINSLSTAQMLDVVAKPGVVDLLTEAPRSSDELARSTATHSHALYRLLRVAASVGALVEDKSRTFRLTPVAQFLRSDHPQSVRGWAVYAGHPVFRRNTPSPARPPMVQPGQRWRRMRGRVGIR